MTVWGVAQFHHHYQNDAITRAQIFAYTYAVLHAPVYRAQYATDLKRHFPRLPFYDAFYALAELGQQLLALHTDYEEAVPYPLQREDHELTHPAPKLRRSKEEPSAIAIDDITTLRGVPNEAWDYVLGTRSALAWVLDQYKEKKDDLPSIDGLQPYHFSDHKEDAIVLLRRVCTVSCETMRCCKEIDCLTQPSTAA